MEGSVQAFVMEAGCRGLKVWSYVGRGGRQESLLNTNRTRADLGCLYEVQGFIEDYAMPRDLDRAKSFVTQDPGFHHCLH